MDAYRQLSAAGVTTRAAAALTGVSRATAGRTPAVVVPALATVVAVPANRLSAAEQAQVLAVLTGAEFIDATPLQIYAVLLERGEYLCSVSTMYRILTANCLVKDRRRQARHPARARPELIATGPGPGVHLGHHEAAGPGQGASTTTPTS
jgi:putative transposase